jgi:hypothetical protein
MLTRFPTSRREEVDHVSTTAVPERAEEEARRTGLVEALLDNLPAWTVVAAAIAFLYLVWATLEILSRYVGGIPSVGV